MAQYDHDPNPSHTASTGIPYVVVVQSDLLDALSMRATVLLAVQAPKPSSIRICTCRSRCDRFAPTPCHPL